MNIYKERIEQLKTQMRKLDLSYFIIRDADEHNSEYVGDHFKVREYFSGFTGSNGTLLITMDQNYLWTDGRYFIQAINELEETDIVLMKMGEENTPTLLKFLEMHIKKGQIIGFDGRVMPALYAIHIQKTIEQTGGILQDVGDLSESIWENRPEISSNEIFVHPLQYAGQSVEEKIKKIKNHLSKHSAEFLFLSKLDDIMWCFNLRGSDIECNPVGRSYAYITKEEQILFIQEQAVTTELINYFKEKEIRWQAYENVFNFLSNGLGKKKGIACESEVNYRVYDILKKNGNLDDVRQENPVSLWKAIKNETEIKNMEKYFLMDSVSVCRFLYWLAHTEEELDEKKAADFLDDLRSQNKDFFGVSFPTISAYGKNAAMMHYDVNEGKAATIQAKGFLLVDSGGQYKGATTDVTRTIVMGDISEEEKHYFTLVTMGMLRLQNAVFLHGCTGRNLDILAREPLWEQAVDYKCGTGHGIGYFLNVHEGPQSIRWKYVEDSRETVLEAGMLITDEPGVYFEGKFGIRIENTLLIEKKYENSDGTFLKFRPLTYVPIDRKGIQSSWMEGKDIEYLNQYHEQVYRKVSPYLDEKESEWLREVTNAI